MPKDTDAAERRAWAMMADAFLRALQADDFPDAHDEAVDLSVVIYWKVFNDQQRDFFTQQTGFCYVAPGEYGSSALKPLINPKMLARKSNVVDFPFPPVQRS